MTGLWLALLTTAAHAQDWRVVAAYDSTSVAQLDPADPAYVWLADTDMMASCGPAKSPDGLGTFEAEAVSNGLTPTLALVLERTDPQAPPLTTHNLRVALGSGEDRVLLQPMVAPRHLSVSIDANDSTTRYQQLVRTQIEVETCLEHKTGRAWTGQDTPRLRQAFLLDPPAGLDPSRKYFGGQQDPVPALTGPPDACMQVTWDAPQLPVSGRGEGSMSLVPTDVWGATLRPCTPNEAPGRPVLDASPGLTLSLSGQVVAPPRRFATWENLHIALSLLDGDADEEARVHVAMSYEGTPLVDQALFQAEADEDGSRGIIDLMARVPYRFPTIGPEDDADRYAVLLIPNWQLVEALRRIERASVDEPLHTSPVGITDAVGTVLSHPDMLFVQTRPANPEATEWPNLASVLQSRTLGQPWGFAVASHVARSPIALPRPTPPSIEATLWAQRAMEQALLLASFLIIGIGVLAGLRRLPDLWSRVPEERANYWPGLGDINLAETEWNKPGEEEEA